MSPPAVSVLMSVRNGERWVAEAVESILKQTWTDVELIVMNDGSVDHTEPILDGFEDPRLHCYHGLTPRGLTRQLVRAAWLARAPLLARLDADDTAEPDRLAQQVEYLRAHPEVGLLGTGAYAEDRRSWVMMPCGDAEIRRALIRRNPFIHASVMFRRTVYDQAGGYDARVPVAQDYDLWMRMARLTYLANLPEPLVTRRRHPNQISLTRARERRWTEARVRWRAVRRGQFPWWAALYAAKPLLGIALNAWRRP